VPIIHSFFLLPAAFVSSSGGPELPGRLFDSAGGDSPAAGMHTKEQGVLTQRPWEGSIQPDEISRHLGGDFIPAGGVSIGTGYLLIELLILPLQSLVLLDDAMEGRRGTRVSRRCIFRSVYGQWIYAPC